MPRRHLRQYRTGTGTTADRTQQQTNVCRLDPARPRPGLHPPGPALQAAGFGFRPLGGITRIVKRTTAVVRFLIPLDLRSPMEGAQARIMVSNILKRRTART